jgi:hypothetical protein
MKFLCVPCDTPMQMRATEESEPGSLSVIYTCPACGYEMAMLTNRQETNMVRSLGVRIGPAAAAAIAAPGHAAGDAAGLGAEGAGSSKCPFSAMLNGASAADSVATASNDPVWTPEALARLEAIPEMVRPMARAGIEQVARENGSARIDETVLAAARARFNM